MASNYPVFELTVDRRLGGEYELTSQYFDIDDDEVVARGPVAMVLDNAAIDAAMTDGKASTCGNLLALTLFENGAIREQLRVARANADLLGTRLRFRLRIKDAATDLQRLDWERLGDPERLDWENPNDLECGEPLFGSDRLLFSRFLWSLDYRRATSTPQREPNALIAVANPSDLSDFGRGVGTPQPIRVNEVVAAADAALAGWRIRGLTDPGAATRDALRDELRENATDVLYLVCHGFADGKHSKLLLEDGEGRADPIRATDLSDDIGDLLQRPRLVVLASCQSAGGTGGLGDDPGSAIRWRLGPELCRAGVPAVLAMQGNLTQETADVFLPAFFRGIERHGQLDLAMAEARERVRDRPDWSVPTLYLRLRTGRLWARASQQGEFGGWPELKLSIRNGTCLPIFGPGASERLLGSKRDIAHRLADNLNFPLAPYQADQLQQVANYIQVRHGRGVLRDELRRILAQSLHERYARLLASSADGIVLQDETNVYVDRVDEALAVVTKHLAGDNVSEPHEILAGLPFPLYLSTEPTDVLTQAINNAGRGPVRAFYRWRAKNPIDLAGNTPIDWPDDPLADHTGWEPTFSPDGPVVYHLFGHVGTEGSVALTEDDFFEFLIGVDSRRESRSPLHPYVAKALAKHLLLFVGFGIDDWEFRVLLRTITRLPGHMKLDVKHVAVQLDPEESDTMAPDRARAYLAKYLSDADMNIYWGSAETFAAELARKTDDLKVRPP